MNSHCCCCCSCSSRRLPCLPATLQGCSTVICMPLTTPDIKVKAVRALGGTVELVGESYQEAEAHSQVQQAVLPVCQLPGCQRTQAAGSARHTCARLRAHLSCSSFAPGVGSGGRHRAHPHLSLRRPVCHCGAGHCRLRDPQVAAPAMLITSNAWLAA